MQMVVMDYIATAPTPPTDARQQLHDVLSILHAAGYAFGDLREPNVLFDKDNKIKLIDFNWCGRYNMEVEYPTLPDSIQKMILNKDSFPTLPLYEYAHYPSNLSTSINWPAGVKSLEPILPRHDWEMWDRLWRSS
jgi:serine/threonine protein kinase